jgi:peptide/nickel transport system substrate-binding protein
MQMYTTTMPQPDPERFMNQYVLLGIATKDNKWQGRNVSRFRNERADRPTGSAQKELDPVKRAALLHQA